MSGVDSLSGDEPGGTARDGVAAVEATAVPTGDALIEHFKVCDCHDSWDQCPCGDSGHPADGSCGCCEFGIGLCGERPTPVDSKWAEDGEAVSELARLLAKAARAVQELRELVASWESGNEEFGATDRERNRTAMLAALLAAHPEPREGERAAIYHVCADCECEHFTCSGCGAAWDSGWCSGVRAGWASVGRGQYDGEQNPHTQAPGAGEGGVGA